MNATRWTDEMHTAVEIEIQQSYLDGYANGMADGYSTGVADAALAIDRAVDEALTRPDDYGGPQLSRADRGEMRRIYREQLGYGRALR